MKRDLGKEEIQLIYKDDPVGRARATLALKYYDISYIYHVPLIRTYLEIDWSTNDR